MRIKFTVNDRPPQKHGEQSVWAQDAEAPRIVSLRKAALEARQEAGADKPFDSLVAMEIHVFMPRAQLESIGGLDSLVTGVIDGLQAVDANVTPHQVLQELPERANPSQPLLITNAAKVVLILTRKMAFTESQEFRYEVAVEEIPEDAVLKAE